MFVQYKLDTSTFQRYTDFLETPNDLNLTLGKKIPILDGQIDFENIVFSYSEVNIFNQLSFKINGSASVALVGESGSGKSTIVKLITGLLKPQSVNIFIDGSNLSDLNLQDLYNHISYTSQESPIFSGTLRENIVFNHTVSDQEILAALEAVELLSFYSRLPRGLDTEIGKRGMTLSGVERQRIAFARLYFTNAKIIILDEATSAMDNLTEELVIQNLMRLLKNKTIISIAHRLNTIKDVETIYVFQSGGIVESGSFDELLEHDSYFKELWRASTEK